MLIGALIAAVVGALLAIPMMRLGGIFLSLATLAFAFFFDQVVLQLGWVGAGTQILVVPRPVLGPIDFSKGDKAYLVLTLVVLALVSFAVIWVRSGTTGRALDAMRGSEVAAASIGINNRRLRIIVFALSAAIAGLGGGLMITYIHLGTASNIDSIFVPELGLAWIVLVVTLGSRTVEGAINAAVGFVFFEAVILPTWIPFAVDHLQPWYHMTALPAGLQPILFGLGALTYAKHPEGHSRVPEASLVRAHPGLGRPVRQGRRQEGRRRPGRPRRPRRHPRRCRGRVRIMTLLVAKSVTKHFAGITALNDVSLEVGAGEIVGLIGPERRGQDDVLQLPARPAQTRRAARSPSTDRTSRGFPRTSAPRLGIARTFQRIELFVGMTPREHFLIADRIRGGKGALWKDMLNRGGPTEGRSRRAPRRCSTCSVSRMSRIAWSSR